MIENIQNVKSFDVDVEGNFLFIDNSNSIFFNENKLDIEFRFADEAPFLKIIRPDLFLFVDRNVRKGFLNALIFTADGEVLVNFFIDSPSKIITTHEYIIVSYGVSLFDTDSEFGNSKIVVFDLRGNVVFRYNAVKNLLKINFLEVVAMQKVNECSVLLCLFGLEGNSDLPIVKFDLMNFTFEILFYLTDLDEDNLIYPLAFVTVNNDWYFYCNNTFAKDGIVDFYSCVYKKNSDNQVSLFKRLERKGLLPVGLNEMGFVYLAVNDSGHEVEFQLSEIVI